MYKHYRGRLYLGPQVVSFVERYIVVVLVCESL